MTVNVESSKMSCYFMGKQIHFTCSKPLKNTSNFGKSVLPFEGHILRVIFKLVRDFSVAPYKPSDSAQKFDGPLNLAS